MQRLAIRGAAGPEPVAAITVEIRRRIADTLAAVRARVDGEEVRADIRIGGMDLDDLPDGLGGPQ
jgi:hypothetical protein